MLSNGKKRKKRRKNEFHDLCNELFFFYKVENWVKYFMYFRFLDSIVCNSELFFLFSVWYMMGKYIGRGLKCAFFLREVYCDFFCFFCMVMGKMWLDLQMDSFFPFGKESSRVLIFMTFSYLFRLVVFSLYLKTMFNNSRYSGERIY